MPLLAGISTRPPAMVNPHLVIPANGYLFLDYPTVFQIYDAIAVACIHFRMRDLNDRRAFIVETFEHVHNLFALRRMKIAGRLIRENDPRICDDCARDAD